MKPAPRSKSKLPPRRQARRPGQFELLFQNNPLPMWVYDIQSLRFLDVNLAAIKQYGYTRAEFLRMRITDIRPEQDVPRLKAHVQGKRPRFRQSGEWTHRRKDGSLIEVEVTSSKLSYEGRAAAWVMAKDITGRKQAEAALRENRAELAGVIDSAMDGIIIIDEGQHITTFNPAAEKIFHRPARQVLGQPLSLLIPRAHRQKHQQEVIEFGESGKTRRSIGRLGHVFGLHADGSQFPLEVSISSSETNGKKQYTAIVRDITERQQAEDQIRQALDYANTFISHSPVGILTFKATGETVTVNEALLKMIGGTRSVVLAQNFRRLQSWKKSGLLAAAEEALSSGREQALQTQVVSSFGRKFWVDCHLVPFQYDGEQRLLAVMDEITERKLAEDKLQQNEARLRSLYENSSLGLYRTTPDGQILLANPAIVQMLGYSSFEELAKQNLETGKNHSSFPRRMFKELVERDGEVRGLETTWTRKDGSRIFIRESARAIRDPKGKTVYYEGTVEDISERKLAEAALQASESELRATITALPDMVLVVDKEGRYLKVTPTDPNLKYMPPESVLGRRMHEIFSRQKADRFVGYIRKALRTRQPVWFEYAQLIGNQILWFSGAAAPLTKDSVVWVARDITPQKRAEEQIQRRLKELETLYESGLAFSRSLNAETIGKQIIQTLKTHLSWHHAAVRLRREESDEIELLAFSGSSRKNAMEDAKQSITHLGQGLSGWVIEHGEAVRVGDLKNEPRYIETFAGMRSGMYIPMKIGELTLGCITVESQQAEAFDGNDERLLTTLAAQAAAAIQNVRLIQQAQRRARESETLYEITAELAAQHDLPSLLESIAERVTRLFHVPGGTVYLFHPGQQELEVAAVTHKSMQVGTRLRLGEGVAGNVAQTRQPLIVDDYRTSPYFLPRFGNQPFTSVMEVPMLYRGELVGVLVAFDLKRDHRVTTGDSHRFTERDMRLLELFAGAAAGAVYSARLYRDALQSAERWATLHAISQEIAHAGQDLEQVYQTIHQAVARVMPAEAFTIVLLDPTAQQLDGVYLFDRGGQSPVMHIPAGQGFSSRVLATGESILIQDALSQPVEAVHYGSSEVTRSILAVPLRVSNRLIGVISAQSYQPDAYSQDDKLLLELLATQAAITIENTRLFEQTSRRAQEFETLYKTTRNLSLRQQEDLPSLLQTLVESAVHLLRAYGCGMYLYDPVRNDLELAVVSNQQEGRGARVNLGEGGAGQVAQTRTPLVIDDYQTWEGRRSLLEGVPYRAVVQVPMLYSGELIGVLDVYEYGDSQRKFTDGDVQLLSHFAAQAAGAIHNSRQFEQISRRAEELGVLAQISSALRTANGRAEMLPIIIQQLSSLLNADDVVFADFDPLTREVVIQNGYGYAASLVGTRIPPGAGLLGSMIQTGKLYITPDIRTTGLLGNPELVGDIRCVAVIPLVVEEQVIGLLGIAREEKDHTLPPLFSERELSLMTAIGDMVANALRRDSLHEETIRYNEQLMVVNRLGRTLAESLDLEQVYGHLSQSTLDLLPHTEAIYITLVDDALRSMHVAYGIYNRQIVDVSRLPEIRVTEGDPGPASQVIHTGEALIINDLRQFINSQSDPQISMEPGEAQTVSALYVPMISDGKVGGILQVQSSQKNRYTPSDARLLTLVANTAVVAIQNALHFHQLQERVEQLSVLHIIDATISSTTDQRVSLQVLLDAAIRLLKVDAADVLTYNPVSLTLEYAAGVGFQFNDVTHTAIRLGEDLAGRAALTRLPVELADLAATELSTSFREMVTAERFVAYSCIPLITKGEIKGILEIFQRRLFKIDKDWNNLFNLLAGQAAIAIDNATLFSNLQRANVDLEMAYDATIDGWSQALELRDHETQGHTHRLLEMTLNLSRRMGIPESELPHIRRGVLLHDIGKMGVPDGILLKPGPLDEEEWKVMRRHPESAYKLLAPIAYLRSSLDIPYCHHERWDGTGYPRGLAGEQIPLAARLFSVIDVYDALSYDRPYRAAWPKEKVIAYIREQSGKMFDPQVVNVFLQMI